MVPGDIKSCIFCQNYVFFGEKNDTSCDRKFFLKKILSKLKWFEDFSFRRLTVPDAFSLTSKLTFQKKKKKKKKKKQVPPLTNVLIHYKYCQIVTVMTVVQSLS